MYLFITKQGVPYYGYLFNPDYFVEGMTVIDTDRMMYTTDGSTWSEVEFQSIKNYSNGTK